LAMHSTMITSRDGKAGWSRGVEFVGKGDFE
jgi:hypothetical protein